MKKRQICIGLISLAMMSLTACDGTTTSEATESQASESQTYGINKTSIEGSEDSEYEISDMLPRPSDDTFIMTVEEAEAFMNKNANIDTDSEAEEPDEPEE